MFEGVLFVVIAIFYLVWKQTGSVYFIVPIIIHKVTHKKRIALTFDDGPHPKFTKQIIDILQEYSIKATFFVTGENAEKEPNLIKEIIANGNEIGNHSYSHKSLFLKFYKEIETEIKKTDSILRNLGVKGAIHYRPPFGRFFLTTLIVLSKMHKKLILWNLGPKDFKAKSSEEIYLKILKNVFPGSIILLHDGNGDRTKTIIALQKIIPELLSQGYIFETISEFIEEL